MQDENLIFGINPIQQLLNNNPEKVIEVFISTSKDDRRTETLISCAKTSGISVQRIDPKKLDKWLEGMNHQGVAAKIVPPEVLNEADIPALINGTAKPLFLVLDGVQDPHNLGACLRTADAAGVTAVIVPKDNAVGITAIVRKVASGAADSVPLVRVSNLARTIKDMQQLGVWFVGTDAETEQLLYSVDLTGSIAIVLGAEGEGMRQLTKKSCDYLVKLPMLGQVESLNVSVATGICLFEALRQRL
jgi:23S rRNA (guanosine2251-2'-O)-methyltransferase